ncbi:MAG TPA: DUF2182 domain-containing protein [Allosphingosinicella sp.]|nr:DUF2182 domain-containing protein [Allosphingosinicella sp.]
MSPDPGRGTAAGAPLIDRILVRDQWLVGSALLGAAALAWWWVAADAAAHEAMAGMAPDPWSPAYLGPAFAMWALMMAAMMLPSATPMILLYARFARNAAPAKAPAAAALFVLAYLAVWSAFSAGAALAQAALVASGLVSQMALALGDRRLAGGLLVLAGLYQLTPLKQACLAECRSPLSFLIRLWRPGPAGALRLGLAHGGYCLGCCWALMALLFVGGVMNLAWVAVLAALVFAEKLAPPPVRATGLIAATLIAAGAALLAGLSAQP